MKRAAPILIAVLLIAGCATPPDGGGNESVDTSLTLPGLPDRVSLERSAEAVLLPLEGVEPELRDRLSSGALSLEGRYTPAAAEPILVTATYSDRTASVPLSGLSPGEEYSLALRFRFSDEVGPWSEAVSVLIPPWEGKLSLSILDPLGRFPLSDEPLTVVDPTPQFLLESGGAPVLVPTEASWRVTGATGGGERDAGEPAGAAGRAAIRDGAARFEAFEALPEGRLLVEIGLSFPNGLVLPKAGSFELRLGEVEPPEATAHGFGRSVVERPALRWAHQAGISGYEVAFQSAGGTPEQLAEAPTEIISATLVTLDPGDLEPGTEYDWRVRPVVDEEEGPWSEVYRFLYQPVSIPFATVIESGERVSYTQGLAEGSGDESPPREVVLTVPYEIGITELTNSVAAALINSGIAHRRFRVNGLVVESADEAVPLVHLDTLEYGEQIGLSLGAEEAQVVAVTGRANHPAVGLTWRGANALAEELTLVDGTTVVGEQWGYRLPTEAEWEYAATGGTGRVYPWGEASPRGRANYYRSGDSYEDVTPPYTRNGGPTTPVGFFGAASPFGARDVLGNVWEWCLDWYDPEAYASGGADDSRIVDPRGAEAPVPDEFGVAHRSLRGLAWNSRVEDLRVQNRGKFPPESSSWSIGVRLLRTPLPLQ